MSINKTQYAAAMVLTFIIIMSAFFLPVYGATDVNSGDSSDDEVPIVEYSETFDKAMVVNATWLDAEMLRIDVTDLTTGSVSSLALRLRDFISDSNNNPYVLIQAADLDGNLSGVIRIANPFYVPPDYSEPEEPDEDEPNEDIEYDKAIDMPGLTPNGAGTVVDNVVTQNGVEFFTVYTEEGNVFYLVIDRQSNSENVHLLNAVTEADLMALAERSGNPIENPNISAIPPIEVVMPTPEPTPEPPVQEPEPISANNNSNLIIIGVVAVVAGAVAYYFKIVKPKQNADYDDEDYGDPDSDDDEPDEDFDPGDGGDER